MNPKSGKKTYQEKALITYRAMNGKEIAKAVEFMVCDGVGLLRICDKIASHLKEKNRSVAQKDPDRLIGKLVSHVRRQTIIKKEAE